MSGFESPNFTQIPNDLFSIMGDMDECELKVVLYICRFTFGYHRNSFKISTRKMATSIGMNTASVSKGAEAAEKRGLIERVIDGQNTTEWRAIVTYAVSEIESPNEEVIQKLNHPVSDSESQVGLNKDKEKNIKDIAQTDNKKKITLPAGSDMAWEMLAGVSSEAMAATNQKIRFAKEATDQFEKDLGFNPLPWCENSKWTRFQKFAVEEYRKDHNCFRNFASKRLNEGKFSRLPANPKIYQDPDLLIAIWPGLYENETPKIIKAENGSGFYA